MSTTTSSPENQDNRIVIPLATDERCWFKCRQSNAGRLRGQEPMCSLFCYYSNKLPSIIKDPITVLKSSHTTSSRSMINEQDKQDYFDDDDDDDDEVERGKIRKKTELEIDDEGENRWDELVNKYTFNALEGKYFYFATGKPAIIRHLSSMSHLGSLEHDWLLQRFKSHETLQHELDHNPTPQKSPPSPKHQIPDKSYRGLMVLAYHKDYENVINIAHSIATGLASIHAHVEKIYGPGYKIISKLPQSIKELRDPENDQKIPSQFTLIHNLFNKPLLSDSLHLLNRSFNSLSEVLNRLATKYTAIFDNNNTKNFKPNDRGTGSSNKPPST